MIGCPRGWKAWRNLVKGYVRLIRAVFDVVYRSNVEMRLKRIGLIPSKGDWWRKSEILIVISCIVHCFANKKVLKNISR